MAVYDDQKDKQIGLENPLTPDDNTGQPTGSGLKQLENKGAPYTASNTSGQQPSKTLSPQGLHTAEQKAGASSNTARSDDTINSNLNGGFWKEDSKTSNSSSRLKKALAVAQTTVLGSRRKKLLVGGGVGGLIALFAMIFGLGGLVSYELVHIEKNLVHYEAKIEQHFEKGAAKKIIQETISRLKNKSAAQDQQDASKETASGEELAAEMDSFDITSPQVKSDLAKAGVTVETDAAGNFTGLKDAQGNDITNEIGTNNALFDQVEAGLPEWDVGQIESFRKTMYDWADSSFDVLPDSANDNGAKKIVEDTVAEGADAVQASEATLEEDQQPPDKNATPTEQQTFNDAQGLGNDLVNAENTVMADVNSGMSESQAIADATSKFTLGNTLLASVIVSDLCSIKKVATEAANSRVPEIITLLIRHGTTLISLADQIKSGNVTSKEVNQVMSIFNGNPAAQPNSNGTPTEASMPFSSSAGWQQATSGFADPSAAQIQSSAIPTANTGTNIVSEINGLLDKVSVPGISFLGANGVCALENSAFGTIANSLGGIVQLFGDGFSFGTSQVIFTGGLIFVQHELQSTIIPAILRYFTPIGIDGHENSVQWLNNAGVGLNLSFGNYARSIGGSSLNKSQADTLTTAANNANTITESRLPWTTRIFALSNPQSLAARLVGDLPLGLDKTVSSIASYFANLPSTIFHGLANIILHPAFAVQNNANAGYVQGVYGITQYGLTDSAVNKYDPISNEQYLFSTVYYDGHSARRIDMLGNPNIYTSSPCRSATQGCDPNNNDLLHCYVDSYAQLADSTDHLTDAAKEYCGAVVDPNTGLLVGGLGTFDCQDQGQGSSNGTQATSFINDPNCIDNPDYFPGNQQVIQIYCQDLVGNPNDPACDAAVAPQIHDDVGHFEQYLVDTHVMADYTSLSNNK